MKLPGPSSLLVIGVVLVAGALLWKQQQEFEGLRTELSVADHEVARLKAEHADFEKQTQVAQGNAKALETALAIAQTAAAAKAAAPRAARVGSTDGEKLSLEQVQQWLADANDPAVMRRLNTQARNQTLRRFDELLKQLNLPPAQNEAFIKLLTDKRQVGLDSAVALFQQGEDPTKDMDGYRDLMIANRDSIEAQINSLLGPTGYAQYQDNLRSTGQSNVVSDLQLTLSSTSDPLTPDQAAQIQQVMQTSNTSRITAKVISASKDFLTPVQMQALQDLRAIQQANAVKRTQPVQVLPTLSAPPAAPGK